MNQLTNLYSALLLLSRIAEDIVPVGAAYSAVNKHDYYGGQAKKVRVSKCIASVSIIRDILSSKSNCNLVYVMSCDPVLGRVFCILNSYILIVQIKAKC